MISHDTFLTRFLIPLVFVISWSCTNKRSTLPTKQIIPVVVSTWDNRHANKAAMDELVQDRAAIDAIEAGIRITEADTTDTSVGRGGLPDSSGVVTLDACIMDHQGRAGSVTYLKDFPHPISVARRIMDSTNHVMLSGSGAYEFAINQGFARQSLLTNTAKKTWEEWKKSQKDADNHDTIGMLAIDKEGNISGGCSTSGMAYKLPGRVGDSPIIGAGLFIDNKVGGATATGKGEEVMKTLGSFLIVELMRQGHEPQKACEIAVKRIIDNNESIDFQIGYLALDKQGRVGAYSVDGGFVYTTTTETENVVNEALSYKE